MRASTACTLPTCLCSSPERERIKTSNSGQSGDVVTMLSSGCGGTWALFVGVRERCLTHPAALFLGAAARLQTLAIAGAVAADNAIKFIPVNLTEAVVLSLRIPGERWVGNLKLQEVRLRGGHVDEVLAQFVV